jgi:trk system potassium uptake protein TrkH
MISFRENPWVLLVVASLITLGGLGFAVLAFARLKLQGHRRFGVATQVRLVLIASAVLVVVGTVWFAVAEWDRSLAGLGTVDKLVNALFQSVTLRTAGFNSVDFAPLAPATLLLMMLFMFIGASPGGTGGGIKTTTAAVLLSTVGAIGRGEGRVVILGRKVPLETVYRSAAIAVLAAGVTFAAGAVLLVTQAGRFEAIFFETVSAMGTVGLSLGVTPGLDPLGKAVVILVMVVGRVGPLSLALLLGRRGHGRLGYPEARIMVG